MNPKPNAVGYRTVGRHELSSIDTLAEKIGRLGSEDPHYALFLGAGASIMSGIPSGEHLVGRWKRRALGELRGSQPSESEFTEWLEAQPDDLFAMDAETAERVALRSFAGWRRVQEEIHGRDSSDYSLLFNYFYKGKSDRQQLIETLIDGHEPGPGYIYLAALVLAGRFRIILTTNFDDLVHDALFRYAGVKPIVCAFDSQVASIRLGSPRPKVIKLHGDFLYDSIRNTSRETERLEPNMDEKLHSACVDRGLIVLGYAGADRSVMSTLRGLLERRDDALRFGLHWCLYERSRSGAVRVPEAAARLFRAFPDRVHLYATAGFDQVMESFADECGCDPPPLLARPVERSLFRRLNGALVASDRRYLVSPGFNRLLRDFMSASFRRPDEAEQQCEEAEFLFQDARSQRMFSLGELAAETRDAAMRASGMLRTQLHGDELLDTLAQSVQRARRAYDLATDRPELRARARRRSSGALGECAELRWHRGELELAREAGRDAVENAREGLNTAKKRSGAEVERRPLCYNALSGLSVLRAASSGDDLSALAQLLDLGRAWYEELVSRDVDGEDLRELRRDVPGWSELEPLLATPAEGK